MGEEDGWIDTTVHHLSHDANPAVPAYERRYSGY